MQVSVLFHSYFKDLTGCTRTIEDLPEGSTLRELFEKVLERFPALAKMKKSTLMAVGIDYQPQSYVLQEADEVSLFPPVQGG